VYSSPPPGSGAITESIIKMFDNFGFSAKQRSDKDVYLKLLECFKFAYAQRSKLGDPFNSPYQYEIEKVNSYGMKPLVIRVAY
jgi:gamma-glutamyltranspeptidase